MDDTERSPRSTTKDQKLRKAMVKSFYDCIFEDTLVCVILKFHRELAIGKSTGIFEDEEDDPALSTSSTEHYDIFGQEATNVSKRSVECKCFVCHRLIAATRFMPHLEKCIGIGRNSRVTRRKAPNYVENPPPSLPIYSKLTNNTRARSTSSNIITDMPEDNEEDDEWSNSTNNSRKRPKTRSTRRTKNTG